MIQPLFVFQSDDPQQNLNSFLTSVFNTVSYALSHSTFFFLSLVAQKTSKLRYSDWLLRNFNQWESGYLSYHGEQNRVHHAKEHWKLSWKLVSKNSLHFVGGHHSEKQTVIRNVFIQWFPKFQTFYNIQKWKENHQVVEGFGCPDSCPIRFITLYFLYYM